MKYYYRHPRGSRQNDNNHKLKKRIDLDESLNILINCVNSIITIGLKTLHVK